MEFYQKPKSKLPSLFALYVIPLLLLVWQIAASLSNSNLILPSPLAVFKQLLSLSKTAVFWQSAGLSLFRVLVGFLFGAFVGILFATLSHFFRLSDPLFQALVLVIRSTPVVSFIIISWFYLETEALPTFIAALMVIPIFYANLKAGLSSIDPHLREVAWVYRMTPLRKFKTLIFPSVTPYLSSATVTGSGLAWKAGIAAEVIVQIRLSLGREMFFAKNYLETEKLFAYTLTVVLLSLAFELLLRRLLKKEVPHAEN
jgi:NitT/TauT family transport system permease protein